MENDVEFQPSCRIECKCSGLGNLMIWILFGLCFTLHIVILATPPYNVGWHYVPPVIGLVVTILGMYLWIIYRSDPESNLLFLYGCFTVFLLIVIGVISIIIVSSEPQKNLLDKYGMKLIYAWILPGSAMLFVVGAFILVIMVITIFACYTCFEDCKCCKAQIEP